MKTLSTWHIFERQEGGKKRGRWDQADRKGRKKERERERGREKGEWVGISEAHHRKPGLCSGEGGRP